jgi:hypothetical protein
VYLDSHRFAICTEMLCVQAIINIYADIIICTYQWPAELSGLSKNTDVLTKHISIEQLQQCELYDSFRFPVRALT